MVRKFASIGALSAVVMASVALALLAGGYALAAEGAEAHPPFNIMNEVYRALNFLALLAVLYFALRKPVKKYLGERTESVEKAIENARVAKEKAEEQLRENERKLANLQEEVERIRRETDQEGRSIKEKAAAEAEQLSRKILEQAKSTIELEKRSAMNALHAEASLLALELAEKILDESVGPDDQKRLFEDYLSKLGGKN